MASGSVRIVLTDHAELPQAGLYLGILILTVAMGLFNANAARTINQNYENRIRYADGADIRLQETWKMQAFYVSANDIDYNYVEPDPVKYDEPVKQGLCTSMAKVIRTNNISVSRGKRRLLTVSSWESIQKILVRLRICRRN